MRFPVSRTLSQARELVVRPLQDAIAQKYTYWSMRPFQLDPSFKPLVTTPNHPAYPSAHSCLSQAVTATMAYLFPRDTGRLYALVEEASESRIAAGIHTRSDVRVGRDLGWAVAERVITLAKADGSGG